MNKHLALLATLLLAAGCAERNSERTTTMRSDGSRYSENTYSEVNPTITTDTVVRSDFDNSSKGAGARALKGDQDTIVNETIEPSGAAVIVGDENQTSKGAGARSLKRDNDNVIIDESSTVATTTTTTDAGAPNAQGDGAKSLTGANESTSIVQSDAAFVRAAGEAGLAEVKMGELAQQNGGDQAVKDFGQRIVTDHNKANEELMQIATQKGFQIPTAMSSRDEQMMEHLSKQNGADFDKTCSRHAVQAHQKAVSLFKTEAQSGQDPELKAFAQKTLPTLEEHLRMAKQLNKGE